MFLCMSVFVCVRASVCIHRQLDADNGVLVGNRVSGSLTVTADAASALAATCTQCIQLDHITCHGLYHQTWSFILLVALLINTWMSDCCYVDYIKLAHAWRQNRVRSDCRLYCEVIWGITYSLGAILRVKPTFENTLFWDTKLLISSSVRTKASAGYTY